MIVRGWLRRGATMLSGRMMLIESPPLRFR